MIEVSIAVLCGTATWTILWSLCRPDDFAARIAAGIAVFAAVLQWRLFG